MDAAAISTLPFWSSFRLTTKPISQVTGAHCKNQVDEILPSLMICLKTCRAASGSATRKVSILESGARDGGLTVIRNLMSSLIHAHEREVVNGLECAFGDTVYRVGLERCAAVGVCARKVERLRNIVIALPVANPIGVLCTEFSVPALATFEISTYTCPDNSADACLDHSFQLRDK